MKAGNGSRACPSTEDPNTLQNQLDSLTFQLRCAETEKKANQDKSSQFAAHNLALKDECKVLETKYKDAKNDVSSLKNQVKLLQGEKARGQILTKKVEELQEKLTLYETVQVSLQGNEKKSSLLRASS